MNETTSKFEGATSPMVEETKPTSPPGFELLEEVGRGGMGVVYRAIDLTLGREVAVKILQQRFDPASRAAVRFQQESRVTAQLQHPGVPAVYQVGTLDDGRPFLAMKLIEGRTLDALIQENEPIDVPAVIEAIAHAVGYAHARSVIHRDLKPANIMVGAFGEVQVMDWGLSKVLPTSADRSAKRSTADPESTADHEIHAPHDTDDVFTQAGSVLGTPSYMAPEQAVGDLAKIGPRSDVFGLGAILCSMLTGKPPFEGETAEGVRLNAMRGRTEAALARLDANGADPDLVSLCKQCLAFEASNRPADGNEVASQVALLRRAADDRARQAERDRLSAEVRRRAVQKGAIVAAAVLVLGVIGTSAGFHWANSARKESLAKEKEAKEVVRFFVDRVFAAARPKGVKGGLGKDVLLRDAITASLPDLDASFKDQPFVEAQLRLALGTTFSYLGQYEASLRENQRAQSLLAELNGPEHPDALTAAAAVGTSLIRLRRIEEGVRIHEQTLAVRLRLLGPEDADTLESMDYLAYGYTESHRDAEALQLQEKVFAARKKSLGLDHEKTLASGNNLAVNYSGVGRHPDALKLREELLPAFSRAYQQDHPELLIFKANLASGYLEGQRAMEALKLYEEVLARAKGVLDADHPSLVRWTWDMARTLAAMGRGAEAIPYLDGCVAQAGNPANRVIVAKALATRLRHFQALGDPKGLRTTAEMWEKLGRTEPDHLHDSACFRAIASAAFAKGNQPEEAKAESNRAMAWLNKAVEAGFDDAEHLKREKDLDGLRGRDDFRKLIESLTNRKQASGTKK
jgi:eukaryotic-like serine/threonine-protein kinase